MIDKLILGTVQLGIPYGINNSGGKPGSQEANSILSFARDAGIKTLDTARAYGDAMEVIGDYHRSSDFSFKVISKFHAGTGSLENDVKEELVKLNIKQFEAYLFHSFKDFETVSSETTLAITRLKEQRFINKIGVSVYGNDQFEKAIASSMTDIIQLPYNLLDNDHQRGELIKRAKDAGKEIHVRSVFLQGLFFMEQERVPQKISALVPYLEKIKEIACAEKLTVQELALAYVLQNERIDKILIGVDSVEQLKMNVEIVRKTETISTTIKNTINTIKVEDNNLLSPVNWN